MRDLTVKDSVEIPRVNILGVGISAINMASALKTINGWIERRESNYVCITGVHGVIESQRDEQMRKIHNSAGLVTPDGMPLVWISRLKGRPQVERVYGPDLMLAVCELSQIKRYRHFFYGGAPGVPEKLTKNLIDRFPNMTIVGSYSPPFRSPSEEEDEQIVSLINQSKPDIVWVGLSTPKQERWMAEHISRLKPSVLIGVGAAFDFHAGLKKQAPRWIQKIGMEWFFRLLSEPRRLWKRYLVNNPLFLLLIIRQTFRLKNYTLD